MILHLEAHDIRRDCNKPIEDIQYSDFKSYSYDSFRMATFVYCQIGNKFKFLKEKYGDINTPHNNKQVLTSKEFAERMTYLKSLKI